MSFTGTRGKFFNDFSRARRPGMSKVSGEASGRCALSAVGPRHFLGRIYNVGKAKTVMRCERSDVVEGVLGIALSVV